MRRSLHKFAFVSNMISRSVALHLDIKERMDGKGTHLYDRDNLSSRLRDVYSRRNGAAGVGRRRRWRRARVASSLHDLSDDLAVGL